MEFCMTQKQFVRSLLLITMLVGYTACDISDYGTNNPGVTASSPRTEGESGVPFQVPPGKGGDTCGEGEIYGSDSMIIQSGEVSFTEINFILVLDTSKSIEDNRVTAVRSLIQDYYESLAHRDDVTMTYSVIVGHSPQSLDGVTQVANIDGFDQTVLSANPFYVHSNEPAVIRFTPDMTEAERNAAERQLISKISSRNQTGDMRVDNSMGVSDGGELLLFNLNALMTQQGLATALSQGAISPDSAVGLIFMSDENDICHPTQGMEGHRPSSPMAGQDISREQYSNELHCSGVPQASLLSREVARSLYSVGVQEVFSAAYIYTGETEIPGGQNERGHGYLEFVNTMMGRNAALFDLGQLTGDEEAEHLAFLTNRLEGIRGYMVLRHEGREIELTRVTRLTVTVDGRILTETEYAFSNNRLSVPASMSGSDVNVEFCFTAAE